MASLSGSRSMATTIAPSSASIRHTPVPIPPPPAPATTTVAPASPRRSSGMGHRYHARVLEGRAVVVTGGSSGIGRDIALGLSGMRAEVSVVDGPIDSRTDAERAFPDRV